MYTLTNKNMDKLLIDFCILYIKLQNGVVLNYYDKLLIDILDEYCHYVNYKKQWEKRSFLD